MPARRDNLTLPISSLLPQRVPHSQNLMPIFASGCWILLLRSSFRDLTADVVVAVHMLATRPRTVAATQAVCERVFSTARPVFLQAITRPAQASSTNGSVLLLPLSDDACALT